MNSNHIKRYLITTILLLSVLPLLASYLLIDEILDSAMSLVVKEDTQQLLQSYGEDLKRLKTLDPNRQQDYKTTFLRVADELLVYQQPDLLKGLLQETKLLHDFTYAGIVIFTHYCSAFKSKSYSFLSRINDGRYI